MRLLVLLVCLAATPGAFAGDLARLYSQQARGTEAPKRDCPPGKDLGMPGVAPYPEPCGNAVPKPDPGISKIGLERTRCFGSCPAYTVIIQQDGSFRYQGDAFVERMGSYVGSVDRGRLMQVLYYIDAIDYMALDNSYRLPITDNPTVYTMVAKGGRTKVIQNYANAGPQTLWALEQLIDELLETASWQKVESGTDR